MRLGGLGGLVTATSPVASGWLVTASGLLALAVSASSFALLVAGSRSFLVNLNVLGTAIHEAGHAAVCVLTGGGVFVIEIDTAESGVTRSDIRGWFSAVATTAAGYAALPLAGLAAASLVGRGHSPAVLASTVIVMLMILLLAWDPITAVAVLAVGVVAFATLLWAPGRLQTWVGTAEAWLLLTSEAAGLAHLVVARQSAGELKDDAAGLAALTFIPGFVWIASWAALIGWAVWHGAALLWP
ncbi:membrane protein [Amycolatopsis sp. NBRC 101858]|uniref:M50 family metallopeptidase n=1 Tax=Amycolatopsis sp. NBRC 101858 TaxID=3032200 RepID=UPI0024A5897C|nr:M50 family metallopeptidase [Amycolatopsis sp. NBRC 101858]GLY43320.1 membrane protein [Amycolatopsis sp. NBRC 101858]